MTGPKTVADRADTDILDDLVIERPQAIRLRVYDTLRAAILQRRIAPGARLVESALAKAIGVSRFQRLAFQPVDLTDYDIIE